MPSKLTTKEFIQKAKLIHGDKYDYSLSEYRLSGEKIKIICKIHGLFLQTPNNHLSGQNCDKCSINLKSITLKEKNKNEFIKKANMVHNKLFDYSLVNYKNSLTKIKIICKKHGIFEQIPSSHIQGSGCPKCFHKNKNRDNFIEVANKVHENKYDYSQSLFCTQTNKIKIICPNHGEFTQTISHHLSGSGCQKCAKKHKYSTDEFIEKAKTIHNNKYDYDLTEYINSKNKIKITCKIHGVFEQTPSDHLSGKGCIQCGQLSKSYGEEKVKKFLKELKVNFISQHKFYDCLNKKRNRSLLFDFYLPKQNMCIEYNGEQHYRPVVHFGGIEKFKNQKSNDLIKKEYCEKNSIIFIVIKYNENIEDAINKAIFHNSILK